MNSRSRIAMVVLAVGLGGVCVAAHAEPTLRYNYAYVCDRGLRIVVGHCRRDSDIPGYPPTTPEDDYCQVYYPDRPKTGGIEAMGIELRSQLIESLQACGAFGATAATPADNPKPRTTGAAAAPAPTQPRAANTPTAPTAQTQSKTQKQFCDQILRLRSLATQDFRSIDLGPKKDNPAHIHSTSINLVTADDDCFIHRKAGERTYYLCTWHVYDDASDTYDDARIDGVGNMLASCLNGRPEWSEKNGMEFMRFNSVGAEFSLDLVAGELLSSVEPARPGHPSASTSSPAAAPAPARPGSGTAPGGDKAGTRQQFCAGIVQLRSLAPQGFKSIVRGPMKGVPGSSAVSINLPSADSCFVTPNAGKPADYTCSWTLGAATAERQFRGLGNLLAQCLNVRPDWSLMEAGEWMLDVKSAGASHILVGFKEQGFMTLMIQAAER